MKMELSLIILAILIIGYVILYYHVKRSPSLQARGLVPYGPAMLLKTERGLKFMEKLSVYRRFWAFYALLSKFIVLGLMLFITGLLLYQLTLIPSIPKESALGFEYVLALPGINPIIPVVFGIIALIVCLFIHEVAHGILTKANDMDIKSTGLLLFVIPVGAFVEPDNEQLMKTTKKKRTSMYAAGAATNFIFAVIFALILSTLLLGSVTTSYGAQPMIATISSGSPGDLAGLGAGMVITELNGVSITSIDDFINAPSVLPGTPISVIYDFHGTTYDIDLVSGIYIESVVNGSPAQSTGMEKGMIIYSVDGTVICNVSQFNQLMSTTVPEQNVSITMMQYDEDTEQWFNVSTIQSIILGTGASSKGYMGVTTSYAGLGVLTPDILLQIIRNPYSDTETASDVIFDTLRYLALPFSGLSPIPDDLTWVFDNSGPLSGEAFWFTVNMVYWLFWMNFMLATTNCLPAIPLDGGYLFMDWMDTLVSKIKKNANEQERQRIVSTLVGWLTMVVLFSILFMFIGPRIL